MESEGSLPHHNCPPPVPILNQLDPLHNPTSNFLKIHLHMILPSMPGSANLSLSFRFPHQKPVYASRLAIRATFPANLSLLDFIILSILREGYRSLSYSLRSFLNPVISSLLGLFSYTLSLRFSPNVSDQLSHPYKTTGNEAKIAKVDKLNSIVIRPTQHYDIKYKTS